MKICGVSFYRREFRRKRCSLSGETERKIAEKLQIFRVFVCQKVRKWGGLPEQEIVNFEVQPSGSVLERVESIWGIVRIFFGQNLELVSSLVALGLTGYGGRKASISQAFDAHK